MGRTKKSSTIEVSEGLFIKPDKVSGIFHYHFTFEKQVFRKSTRTTDRRNATSIAIEAYDHVRLKKGKGLEIKSPPFKKISQLYLDTIKNESRHKYHSETIQRHILPFFKKFDDISKIKMTDLDAYKEFRLAKNPSVKPQTINRENGVLNKILQFSAERDWIKPNTQLKYISESQTRRRRPHFTNEEYNQLIKASRKRVSEVRPSNLKGQAKGLYANKFYQRQLLHDIIIILANTGMRVDELKGVRWRDVLWDANQIKLPGVGKLKSQRKLTVRPYGMRALERIKKRRLEFLDKNKQGSLDTNSLIQSLPNGKFTDSLKKGFNELLKEAGFKYETIEDKHTLTSLRHFFATIRMTTKTGKRATTQGLAKQMGTSIKMIEKYYGHDTAVDYEDEILG